MIEYARQDADDPDPLPQAAEGGRARRWRESADRARCSIASRRRNSRSRSATATTATSPKTPTSAPTSPRSTAIGANRRASWRKQCAASGFSTPLWALADSQPDRRCARCSDVVGEVDGYIYLGQQTPAFYAKQVDREHHRIRHEPAAAVLRRAHGLRRRSEHLLRLPRAPGRRVLPQVARRPAVLQALRRADLPQRSVQRRRRPRRPADPRRARPSMRSATRRRCSAPTGPTSC